MEEIRFRITNEAQSNIDCDIFSRLPICLACNQKLCSHLFLNSACFQSWRIGLASGYSNPVLVKLPTPEEFTQCWSNLFVVGFGSLGYNLVTCLPITTSSTTATLVINVVLYLIAFGP